MLTLISSFATEALGIKKLNIFQYIRQLCRPRLYRFSLNCELLLCIYGFPLDWNGSPNLCSILKICICTWDREKSRRKRKSRTCFLKFESQIKMHFHVIFLLNVYLIHNEVLWNSAPLCSMVKWTLWLLYDCNHHYHHLLHCFRQGESTF